MDLSGTNVYFTSVSNLVTLNNWHHVGFTYDGSEVVIYVNGVRVGSKNGFSGQKISGSFSSLDIGRWSNNILFNGIIDEVVVWDRVLNGQEVLDLYNS